LTTDDVLVIVVVRGTVRVDDIISINESIVLTKEKQELKE
jgi:ribosomal protein S28E/S33